MVVASRKLWKEIILDIFIEHPEYNATQVRQNLTDTIGKELTPGKSAIQKEWARLRGENYNTSEEDTIWHLGSLDKNPVESASIPVLLEYQNSGLKYTEKRLSIRQAKWVSRLHSVINDRKLLIQIARYYALREKTSELSGQGSFNTVAYDALLHDPIKLLKYFEDEKSGPVASNEGSNKKEKQPNHNDEPVNPPAGQNTIISKDTQPPSLPVTNNSVKDGYLMVNELFFYGDRILIRINVRGTVKRVVLPFTSQEELMNQLQSEKMIESINSIGKDVTHIVLSRPLSISTENRQFREYLLNELQNADITGKTKPA